MPTLGLTEGEVNLLLQGPKRVAEALQILLYVANKPGGATFDECAAALKLDHGSGSPRFSELAHCGCLKQTGKTRATRSGGVAKVCVVPDEANFRTFLESKRKAKRRVFTARDEKILATSKKFLAKWKKLKSQKGAADAIRALVTGLEKAQREPV